MDVPQDSSVKISTAFAWFGHVGLLIAIWIKDKFSLQSYIHLHGDDGIASVCGDMQENFFFSL